MRVMTQAPRQGVPVGAVQAKSHTGEGHTDSERSLARSQARANHSHPVQRALSYQRMLDTSPRVSALQRKTAAVNGAPRPVLQRMRITSGDIEQSAEDAWLDVELLLDDKGIPSRDMPALKEQFLALGEDASFEYYDDIADLLASRLNDEQGTNYPIGEEDTVDEAPAENSGGWGAFAWKLAKYGTLLLAGQSALGNLLPKANAQVLPGLGRGSEALASPQDLEQDLCEVPALPSLFQPEAPGFCAWDDAPPATHVPFQPPPDAKTYSNQGYWKDWINALATGLWSYRADPTDIPGVDILDSPEDLARDGYYAYAYRASDGNVAITHTGTDPNTNNAVAHSYLASGGDVYAAGMLQAQQGQVVHADSASGHYRPDPAFKLDWQTCNVESSSGDSLEYLKGKLDSDGLASPQMRLAPFRHPGLTQEMIDCQMNRQTLSNPFGKR
ncbi:hypothetical protein LXT21_15070 [Myxococcus sp. K38C18041901]|uniref:hypothetical protein n=1 Tax=Myxococcus guangdongensis TaxID=2906760 RepID=UPI0020A73282|nr:hypothetical protein [Myxococcus guangdongensis]MCP3060103.1 hypothetical protein [Myxococcus guangdongensis]